MESIRDVRPIVPPAAYIGGKRNLAKHLVPLIEGVPHRCYAEVFVGMGGVFFRRSRIPPAEVINDRSRDVATLFRILQRHYTPFLDLMRFQLSSRAEFERLTATDPDTLTDLERAARFLYLQRTGWGGKVAGRTFGVSPLEPAAFNISRLGPVLEAVHDRLSGVTVECLDFGAFLGRYDRPETLFYLDPPYWGSEGDYGRELFGRADFARLVAALEGLKGSFILSINDTPETRELFGGFRVDCVETTYSVAREHGLRARELVVTNLPAGAPSADHR